eukprot:7793862-Pyramimonas_sp.AAC.1
MQKPQHHRLSSGQWSHTYEWERDTVETVGQVLHEFKQEGVEHTKKMEERLTSQLKELNRLLEIVESETAALIERKEAAATFTALRVKVGFLQQTRRKRRCTSSDDEAGHADSKRGCIWNNNGCCSDAGQELPHPESSSLARNMRRIFGGIFEMLCAE